MWLCSNCHSQWDDDHDRCSKCGKTREESMAADLTLGRRPVSTRYPVLGIAIAVLEILAWIVLAATVILFTMGLVSTGVIEFDIARLLGGLAAWGVLLVIAAFLRMMLDIEINTRRTADLLEKAAWNQQSEKQTEE